MNTIKDEWNNYKDAIVPGDAGIIQVNETRKAFYAGVKSTLEFIHGLDEYTDDAAEALFESWCDEVMAFAERVLKEEV